MVAYKRWSQSEVRLPSALLSIQGISHNVRFREVVYNPEGGVLHIMAYTGRLRPKGVPFSDFRYKKG